jgi:hypothetical protein
MILCFTHALKTCTSESDAKSIAKTGFTQVLSVDTDAQLDILHSSSARCVQEVNGSQDCKSHYLSHFAVLFIDARTKRSIAESCLHHFIIGRVQSTL